MGIKRKINLTKKTFYCNIVNIKLKLLQTLKPYFAKLVNIPRA